MALYHKHRPQDFSSVVGQDHIIKTIENQLKNNKTAHAYLFAGPRGIGKTTTSRLLAKALNCENRKQGSAEPCNACQSCKEVSRSRAIDVIEIDAASNTGVDNVRENIIDNAEFKPTMSSFKVFIIDEVHMLSTSAFNALLKTLEEPPSHVVFILATTEKHKIPDTIISRCQVFNFKKVSFDILKKSLESIAKSEGIQIEKEVLERIINKSDGCVRDAVSLLDQAMASGEKKITTKTIELILPTSKAEDNLALVSALVAKNMSAGLEKISALVEDGVNLPQFANDTIELLRIMMIAKSGADIKTLGLDLNDVVKKELRSLEQNITYSELLGLADLFLKRKLEIKTSPILQLPLEMLVIEWCNRSQNLQVESQKSYDTQSNNLIEKENSEKIKIEEQKKTIVEKVKDVIKGGRDITKSEVEEKWSDFMKKIEGFSPSLVFIIKMSEIISIDGALVELGVQYKFHQQKLTDKKTLPNLEKFLSEVLNTPASIKISLTDSAEKENKNQDLQNLATAFGGEVVG